jgi:hypothetical protein
MIRPFNMVSRGLGLAGCLLVVEGGAASSGAQDCSGAGIVLSTVAVTGLAVIDIATAPVSVQRYNEGQVTVAPYVNPRDRAYGVSVAMSFGRSRPVLPRPVYRSRMVQDTIRHRKSPGVGLALSFVSTVVPMAAGVAAGGNAPGASMFLAGIVVGPSVGHFYAGRIGRGLGTIALRGLGTAAGVASLAGCFID